MQLLISTLGCCFLIFILTNSNERMSTERKRTLYIAMAVLIVFSVIVVAVTGGFSTI